MDVQYKLINFFSDPVGSGDGPHAFLVGSNGAVVRELAKQVGEEMAREAKAASRARVETEVGLAAIADTQRQSQKRALERARERVAADKKQKAEARKVKLS